MTSYNSTRCNQAVRLASSLLTKASEPTFVPGMHARQMQEHPILLMRRHVVETYLHLLDDSLTQAKSESDPQWKL